MSEINLLQTNNQGSGYSAPSGSVLNKIGVVVLAVVVLIYGFFFIAQGSAEKGAMDAAAQKAELEITIKQELQYPELVKYQTKLNNVKLLLDGHLRWSMVLGKFADATLKTARFDKFVANADGSAIISGFVPDFASLDKQMKAYQLNQFQQYIKDVQLVNVGLSATERIGIDYTLKVVFNKDLIKNVPVTIPVTAPIPAPFENTINETN